MSYKFACPKCGQHISAEARVAGTSVTCPECRQSFVAPPQTPGPPTAPPASIPSPAKSGLAAASPTEIGPPLWLNPPSSPRRHALLVLLCCALPIAALLVPPWQYVLESSGGARIERPARFAPLFMPPLIAEAPANPNERALWGLSIDCDRYLGMVLAAIILSSALWYLGKPRESGSSF